MNSELEIKLKNSFSTSYMFYLKSQNYHWNTTGLDFLEKHILFESIYKEVQNSLDEFAEVIRGLKIFSEFSLESIRKNSYISDDVKTTSNEKMIFQLLEDNKKVILSLKDCYKISEKLEEYGISNFLTERIKQHDKHGWKLQANLTNI